MLGTVPSAPTSGAAIASDADTHSDNGVQIATNAPVELVRLIQGACADGRMSKLRRNGRRELEGSLRVQGGKGDS